MANEETNEIVAPSEATAEDSAALQRRLQNELAAKGVSPAEINRLLYGAPPPAVKGKSKSNRVSAESLQSFAADLMQKKVQEQDAAVARAAAKMAFPEFRESSAAERVQADGLLRDANILRKREKHSDSLEKCQQALNLVPKDGSALELIGDILQGIARIDDALACYQRAFLAEPKRVGAEKKYGDLLMRQQNWSQTDPESVAPNSWAATLLSSLLTGAGQLYNGEIVKGAVFIVVMGGLAYTLLKLKIHRGTPPPPGFVLLLLLVSVVYITSVVDALITSKRLRNRS